MSGTYQPVSTERGATPAHAHVGQVPNRAGAPLVLAQPAAAIVSFDLVPGGNTVYGFGDAGRLDGEVVQLRNAGQTPVVFLLDNPALPATQQLHASTVATREAVLPGGGLGLAVFAAAAPAGWHLFGVREG